MSRASKIEWQRRKRKQFAAENGYSMTSHYGAGTLRQVVLERDNFRCIVCGLTDEEHKTRWGRPITIDHKDKNRANNTMENLRTMCLVCHGRKDLIPALRQPKVAAFREEIMRRLRNDENYQDVANAIGFSAAAIWKWANIWAAEEGVSLNRKRGPRRRKSNETQQAEE